MRSTGRHARASITHQSVRGSSRLDQTFERLKTNGEKALIAYLRTIKPLRKETPRLKTWVPFYRSLLVPLWLKLFGRYSVPPAKAPESGVERGRYLVDHISLCGDCHTLRNRIGVPQRRLYLAGSRIGLLGEDSPNITPDPETGIGASEASGH